MPSTILLVCAASITFLGGTAHATTLVLDEADLPAGVTVTRTPIGPGRAALHDRGTLVADPVFESGVGPTQATLTAALGQIAFDDFTTTLAGAGPGSGTFTLAQFGFIGGAEVAGATVAIDFFDTAFSFVGGFGLQPTTPGVFLYTITLSPAVNIQVPVEGLMFASETAGLPFSWLATDGAPVVGSSTPGSAGNGLDLVYGLGIPAPATAAPLALALLGARRRR
jgi:hypothetical protein